MLLRLPTDDEIEQFWAEGVVCLSGVLDPAALEPLATQIDAIAASGELANLSEMADSLGTGGTGAGRFLAGTDHWPSHPELAAFALRSGVGDIVASLLRSSAVQLYEDSILIKEPGTAERTGWHQDLGYFHVSGEQLCTTWIPFDTVTPESGAVRFVAGSHRWERSFKPTLFVSDDTIPGTVGEDAPDPERDGHRIESFNTNPGDITVHHARTVHAAGPNTSIRNRRALSLRYCGDAARTFHRTGAPLKAWQRAAKKADAWADGGALPAQHCPIVEFVRDSP